MSLVLVVPLISLGLYLVPVYLLRRQTYPRAQDYFVSSEHTPPGVIQNSSIAYALKMATFGPLFAWGASGDFWPAIIISVFFGLGVGLMYVLRRPMLAFLNNALSRDRSVTVHEFIACQHGNDPRVRLLASGLTIFALVALLTGRSGRHCDRVQTGAAGSCRHHAGVDPGHVRPGGGVHVRVR